MSILEPVSLLKMLYINFLRTLGSQLLMLSDVPIKKISMLEEDKRANVQRSHCRKREKGKKKTRREMTGWNEKGRPKLRQRRHKAMHQTRTGS